MLSRTEFKKRDMKIVEFINLFPCYSDTIQKIFFNKLGMTNKTLARLYNDGYIKRDRKHAHEKYFYYIGKKRSRKEHYDLMAKTYHWLLKNDYEITDIKVQKRPDSIEPDMIITIKQGYKSGIIAVEIERATKNIPRTIEKYADKPYDSVLMISNLPTDYIENEHVKVLYNINFKELENY